MLLGLWQEVAAVNLTICIDHKPNHFKNFKYTISQSDVIDFYKYNMFNEESSGTNKLILEISIFKLQYLH